MEKELSQDQKYAFEKFKKGENIFITGPGGSGKTELIKNMVNFSEKTGKKIQVCALTGCASVLLNCNARTIHSWSGIRLGRGPNDKIIANVLRSRNVVKNWKKIKVLIIDEISMMSVKIFNLLDEIGKRIRTSSSPFGGIQVVFSGDFFQLPPVGNPEDPETEAFCFESSKWYQSFTKENHIQLTTIFRQNDPLYIDILSQIRKGKLDEKNIEILRKYVNRPYDATAHDGIVPTKLFPVRSKVEYINSTMFSKLNEDEYQFEYTVKTDCKTLIESGKLLTLEELSRCDKMTTKEREYEIENLVNNTPCERLLSLKKGSAVLCTVNIDMDNSICNGSQGIITDIYDKKDTTVIVVKFSNGVIKHITPHHWQSEEYPTIAIKQYPLSLAWAMTIHKMQGTTLEMAEMDIGQSIFEYGQTYVALSRIKSLDGLYLTAFHPQKIRANPKVIEFYNQIPVVDYSKIVFEERISFENFELKEENFEVLERKNIKVIKL